MHIYTHIQRVIHAQLGYNASFIVLPELSHSYSLDQQGTYVRSFIDMHVGGTIDAVEVKKRMAAFEEKERMAEQRAKEAFEKRYVCVGCAFVCVCLRRVCVYICIGR